ncbi:hypothetical protein MMG00_05435 [Ignatzschineria rhizosphaerae]|uniref:DUF3592 domain-containing protein n=1 Tax=Ignatzschineria rhizosphaerae TaxID=2923279 RepID=A0ABY3X6B5_9GAMM|nr:hypothetical protein [Ignatzschineria rhizosphaerae]UNM97294.1 hypothetical protein MMG00_05435 [Ignatzschineria rhizosphaerae]
MERFMIGFMSLFGIIGIGILIGFYYTREPVMFAVGAMFCLAGWGGSIPLIRKRSIQKRIREQGVAIQTEFVEVILGDASFNNQDGYVVRTKWLDVENNILYYFSSNILWYNPEKELKDIEMITVFVNPKNLKQNYMDLEFLPKRVV